MPKECWICGAAADTREHRVKKSDLSSLFGKPSQGDPLYFHTAVHKNFPVGSLNAKVLKSSARICNRCNSARTQPHDLAWQRFSEAMRQRLPLLGPGKTIRANRIFPHDTSREMRNVHFYFLKLFGCLIVEGSVPLEIASFSDALLQGRPHPNVYLAFGPAPDMPLDRLAGGSDMQIALLNGQCAFATWLHSVGPLWVNVMYARDGEQRQGLQGAWHPHLGCKRLTLVDFAPNAAGESRRR